jgi:hypothetical protein
MSFLIALLVGVSLSPPFVSAEARAVDTSDGLVVELVVKVDASAAAILVRGIGLTEELDPVALVPQGEGRWSGVIRLNRPENIRVAFELIPPQGGGEVLVSEFNTLTELGVDPAFAGVASVAPTVTTTQADLRFTNESTRWGWLALAAGAGGLALLALWVIGGRARRIVGDSAAPDEAEEDVEEVA